MTTAVGLIRNPEDYLKLPYSRVLIPEEEGGYSAEILEFPGCYSQGDTAEEAIRNIEDAASNWIEATLQAGKPIPPPSTDYEYAGKVALRLPRSIHRQAMRMAERDGVSLNQFLVSAIAARVGAEELYNRIAERAEDAWMNRTSFADNRITRALELLNWFSSSSTSRSEEKEIKLLYTRNTGETMEVEG